MKKLVFSVLVVLLLITGSRTFAAPDTNAPAADPPKETLASETIDGISVPYTILLGVQAEFQGFAVADAHKQSHSGQEVYALRMDSNDTHGGQGSFYLLFDMDWKYLSREKFVAAPKPVSNPGPDQDQKENKSKNKVKHNERNNRRDNEEAQDQADEEQADEEDQNPEDAEPQPISNRRNQDD